MNIQITSDRKREWNERKINGSKVYIESNANEAIDAFFSQKNIYELDYPSKVWRSLKREAQKLIIPGIIKTICVIKETKVVYSHKCGCGCGCSPGYNASDVAPEFENASVWLNITFSEEELVGLRKKIEEAGPKLEIEKTTMQTVGAK